MGPVCAQHAPQVSPAVCRQSFLPLKDACSRPAAQLENGAHMEIGVNGDLSTLYWRQNGPWDPDTVPCRVTYGMPYTTMLGYMSKHSDPVNSAGRVSSGTQML